MPTMAPIGDPEDEEFNHEVDEGGRESSVYESDAVAASMDESIAAVMVGRIQRNWSRETVLCSR